MMGNFFLSSMWLNVRNKMQIVGKNKELLTFCKNNRAFCLLVNIKLVTLQSQNVKCINCKSSNRNIEDESTDKTNRLSAFAQCQADGAGYQDD
jgi:hypothetical protein